VVLINHIEVSEVAVAGHRTESHSALTFGVFFKEKSRRILKLASNMWGLAFAAVFAWCVAGSLHE